MIVMAAVDTSARFLLGHELKSREARDHFRQVLDAAEHGGVPVVRREIPVVVVRRDILDSVLAEVAPLDVKSAVTHGQFAFWLDNPPVHAVGDDLDRAEDEFLDALVDYAELWIDELQHVPNHVSNRDVVLRIAMFAGARDELRRVVFGD
jgi:hypothetical protein